METVVQNEALALVVRKVVDESRGRGERFLQPVQGACAVFVVGYIVGDAVDEPVVAYVIVFCDTVIRLYGKRLDLIDPRMHVRSSLHVFVKEFQRRTVSKIGTICPVILRDIPVCFEIIQKGDDCEDRGEVVDHHAMFDGEGDGVVVTVAQVVGIQSIEPGDVP